MSCAPQALKTGFTLLIAKLVAGVLIGLLAAKLFNDSLLGLNMLAIVAVSPTPTAPCTPPSPASMHRQRPGATAIISFNDGPFLTMIVMGAAGCPPFPFMSLVARPGPLVLGIILGNLDPRCGPASPTAWNHHSAAGFRRWLHSEPPAGGGGGLSASCWASWP